MEWIICYEVNFEVARNEINSSNLSGILAPLNLSARFWHSLQYISLDIGVATVKENINELGQQ